MTALLVGNGIVSLVVMCLEMFDKEIYTEPRDRWLALIIVLLGSWFIGGLYMFAVGALL